MKNILFLFPIILLLIAGCVSVRPTDFTYFYDRKDTGLSSRINIDGYYVSERECDSAFFSVFMFYPDGLFTIATTSNADLVAECFSTGGKSKICQYPSWGTYRLIGDTIKTQTVIVEGMASSCIFRDYLILLDGSIINFSDYVNPDKSKLMYMRNYPSFRTNQCAAPARFYPITEKRKKTDCPYLSKEWFSSDK